MKNKKLKLFIFILTIFILIPIFSSAENEGYTPLAPLPGIEGGQNISLGDYIQNSFILLIGVAGILAVIVIMIGGIQYMTTDAIGGKEEGKERITKALLGLLLAIGAWLILNTINPNILNTGTGLSLEELPPPPTSYAIQQNYYLYIDEHTSQGGCRYDAFLNSNLRNERFPTFNECVSAVKTHSRPFEQYPYRKGPPNCEEWVCIGVNE